MSVSPGLTRYFVTVWTESGASAEPVSVTFSGVDELLRVWTAPATQLNQEATEGLDWSCGVIAWLCELK